MVHELKTLPEYFEAAQKRLKNFEVRYNDRHFEVGDFLALNEWTADSGYTGCCMLFEITYIFNNPTYCKDEFVILGLSPLEIKDKNCLSVFGVRVYGRSSGGDRS